MGTLTKKNEAVIDLINHHQPDYLFVAFGVPNKRYGYINIKIKLMQSPSWWEDYLIFTLVKQKSSSLDERVWLVDLPCYQEPRRMWRRYIVGNPKFYIAFINRECIKKILTMTF